MQDRLDIGDEVRQKVKAELKDAWAKNNKHLLNENGKVLVNQILAENGISEKDAEKISERALKHTENETYQSMEALIHNLNSIKCVWHYMATYSEKSVKLLKVPNVYVATA